MPEAFSGDTGTGSLVVYTVPSGYVLSLDIIRFEVVTDGSAGSHEARVTFFDNSLSAETATLRDLNVGGPSMTLTYTYGVGLNASACTTTSGWEMTAALPVTSLRPDTDVFVAVVTDGGVVIPGDRIGPVTLYGDLIAASDPAPALIEPGLLPA